MPTLKTSQGTEFIVDKKLAKELDTYKWQQHKCGYIYRDVWVNSKVKKVWIHREVVGAIPEGLVVDHINGIKNDNRRENLRICTPSQNSANQKVRKSNTSGYKGVTKDPYGWMARITCNGTREFLGIFKDKHDAGEAYNNAALKLHGEFAKLNIIRRNI